MFSGMFNRKGCNSCNSCGGCYGGCHGGYAVVCTGCGGCGHHAACAGYHAPACCGAKPMPDKKKKKKDDDDDDDDDIAAPATIIVTLPADAKLTVDDNATRSTSTPRVLVSPALEPGKEFSYTLKGEIIRDGKPVVATQKITVRAGQETRITLQFPTATVAQK